MRFSIYTKLFISIYSTEVIVFSVKKNKLIVKFTLVFRETATLVL